MCGTPIFISICIYIFSKTEGWGVKYPEQIFFITPEPSAAGTKLWPSQQNYPRNTLG